MVQEDFREKIKSNNCSYKTSILIICQYYYPEPFRISDICEELVKRGYEVMVITGQPNYPEGKIYKGYENNRHRDEVINGVKIHRCNTIPRKKGKVYRFLNYYSYVISSMIYVKSGKCLNSRGKPFDFVFCNQLSPVMMAEAAIIYKKKYCVPMLLYCLDIWPESLRAGNINIDSPIYKFFHKVSKRIYTSADKIFVTSNMFITYLNIQFGIEKKSIIYLPQYAETVFTPLEPKDEIDFYDFMFAGNIGKVQSLDTVIEAAELLKNEKIRFHIIGEGTSLPHLQRLVKDKKLKNVIFYGRRPLKEMPEYYKKADAMLVTLRADSDMSFTLPGKVQTYMACGKPIIGAIDGETETIIIKSECGYCGPAENAKELVQNIRKYIYNIDKRQLGINSLSFYQKNFTKDIFFEKLQAQLCINN